MTVSIGLVFKNAQSIVSDNACYKETDDLLYIAKRDGRNRVVLNQDAKTT
ncbi:GGDEF domain-containing protein [bacterium]|nr:GGDEF domain-containing protein [bacterium]MBU1989639.1 GGDEF domain-containing protein [bacterium]